MGMDEKISLKYFLLLSLVLAALLIVVSCFGLLNTGTYSKETVNWNIQALAQDAVDLFLITPLLIISSFLLYKKNSAGIVIWSGTLLYIIYTFIIYCFAVHFNYLFFYYCLTLGFSFYLLMFFLISQGKIFLLIGYNENIPIKVTGVYLIILACLFYVLWLSGVIPAMINNLTPKEIIEIGLPVNPVHSLDLSIFLPGIFITGFLL